MGSAALRLKPEDGSASAGAGHDGFGVRGFLALEQLLLHLELLAALGARILAHAPVSDPFLGPEE
jgi:hypothetical protein